MAVKDPQYRYFPSQERLVNISNYMINPQQAFSSTPGLQDKHAFRWQHGGYNVSDSFRLGHDRTFVGGAATNPDFEMRNVHWSDDISTVSNLLSLQFPVIVKVVKGYYGHDGQHLIDGQILQVYMSCEELRVTATDSRNRTLTLPINCPLSVRLNSGPHRSGSPQTLSDLLKDVSFPASIDVIGVKQTDNAFSSRMLATLSDTRLTLHEISRQKFLVANAIRKGWLDQSRFLIIPEQLKLTFRRATGIRHVTPEEWKDICGMYSRAARHLKFHLINGYDDVIYDDWINQVRPSPAEHPSPGIASDEEEADDDTDSDSAASRTRSRLLRQQAPLNQGSLPSLPTALRDCTIGSDPGPESRASGSTTPSHLSTESIQPCISTESLLPRDSADSGMEGTVAKETVGKRKSNMPPRLLRRKAEPRRQDTVHATEFELQSGVTKPSAAPRKSGSVACSRATSQSTTPVRGVASVSGFSEVDNTTLHIDIAPSFVFDEPSVASRSGSSGNRESANRSVSKSPACRQGQSSLGSLENVSSDDVNSASLNDAAKKRRKNDNSRHHRVSSDDALFDVQSVDSHVFSPVYWSSDLCIGASASGSESQIARTKQTKAQNRAAILSRDLCANPNATMDRPLSLDCRSPPLYSPSGIQSFGFLDSTQSLFSSTSTELSGKHRILPGDRCQSSEVYGRQRARTYNDAVNNPGLCTPSGSTGHIATRLDYSTPIKLCANRSRKLSNGLIRMKLDQNGTVLSSGSEVIDDGYSTKGNSMTSSVETLRRSINKGGESLC